MISSCIIDVLVSMKEIVGQYSLYKGSLMKLSNSITVKSRDFTWNIFLIDALFLFIEGYKKLNKTITPRTRNWNLQFVKQ